MSGLFDGDRSTTVTIVVLINVVLLCAAVIVGLGYILLAPDRDSGTIGVNATSGECRVDIVSTEGASLLGDVLDFTGENGGSAIFVPGSTYGTEGFLIKNIGTMPLNFRISVSEDEDTDAEDFHRAFEVWITQDPAGSRAEGGIVTFEGHLAVGEVSETYYLFVRMKETAGDEFQNRSFSGIGVTVYAIQTDEETEE